MTAHGPITPDSLMTLEDYDRWRQTHKAESMAHRRLRSVALGEHMRVQFESETSVRYQIQEMLRIERIFEAGAIAQEIQAYAPLVPDGSNWKATLLLEYVEPEQRRQALSQLIDVEDHVYVQVQGHARVMAIADEDLPRETSQRTAAVHFLRFELSPAMRADVRAGVAVALGCDHPRYTAHTPIPEAALRSLASDLTP